MHLIHCLLQKVKSALTSFSLGILLGNNNFPRKIFLCILDYSKRERWPRKKSLPEGSVLPQEAFREVTWAAPQQTLQLQFYPQQLAQCLAQSKYSINIYEMNEWKTEVVRTSSVMMVAMDLPISWYCWPFPTGPNRINKNLATHTKGKSMWVNIKKWHLTPLQTAEHFSLLSHRNHHGTFNKGRQTNDGGIQVALT